MAKEVEEFLQGIEADITVAVMGCAVNGPGEASHADIGIAGGVTANADISQINRAAKLSNNQCIVIPKKGEKACFNVIIKVVSFFALMSKLPLSVLFTLAKIQAPGEAHFTSTILFKL